MKIKEYLLNKKADFPPLWIILAAVIGLVIILISFYFAKIAIGTGGTLQRMIG